MIKTITISELSSILNKQEGKDILMKTGSMGFTFKSFGKVETVHTYTWGFRLQLENISDIELSDENIEYIEHDTELTRDNTNKIKVKLENGQLISFEYVVNE